MRRRHGSRRITRFVVALLLAIHASLLAWQAYRYSPTIDEPAHLAAGISHWKFGRFDLYRVNPPLVRMIAALPMLLVEPKIDWSAFTEAAYARPEFAIGSALANGNGFDIFWDFTLARWACIPFSLIGGYFCYRWGRELYGVRPGIVALILWCFCPNILGNGALITPDVPAAALGVTACYFFWRWLQACDSRLTFAPSATTTSPLPLDGRTATTTSPLSLDGRGAGGEGAFGPHHEATPPTHSTDAARNSAVWNQTNTTTATPSTWPATLLAGLTLGLAELTKSTWIILFALYPAIWLVWTLCRRRSAAAANDHSTDVPRSSPPFRRSNIRSPQSLVQLATILGLALYILNLGYGFENTFQPLGKFAFISKTLGGPDAHEKPGNRFAGTWLASVPVPVPANYLRGIDVQKYDFEKGKWSYLRGEHKFGGWWYYYLYAMGVKMPAGTLALIGLAFIAAIPWQAGWHKLTALRGKPARSVESPTSHMARRAGSGMPATSPESSLANSKSKLVLLVPAVVVLVLISSQTGFSRYLRYAIPAFPFLFIFAGRLAATVPTRFKRGPGSAAHEHSTIPGPNITIAPRSVLRRSHRAYRTLTAAAIPILLLASATSSLAVFPHNLSYFNEVAGGPLNGADHLLDANLDWGQDFLGLLRWHTRESRDRPLMLTCFGCFEPACQLLGLHPTRATQCSSDRRAGFQHVLPRAAIAVRINDLIGCGQPAKSRDFFEPFREMSPASRLGYSILIFESGLVPTGVQVK